jgi:sugar phosphate isomerase/epimerase
MKNNLSMRVAVCSWSLRPESPEDLIFKLQAVGINRVQLALDPLRESPDVWSNTAKLFEENGISIVSGAFGCVGEDYSTLESIRRTGGLMPDSTWEQNWKNIQAAAGLSQQLGLKLVTFHAGFLPHEENDPNFLKLKQRLLQVAEFFATHGITLALETGQETAKPLLDFIEQLNQPNIGINFDPANMILYDKGDPIQALRTLGPWIRQVHIKDARRTGVPGTWGEEVAVGTGEVNWKDFFATLDELRFEGNLCIEREAGNQRVRDIRTAREFVGKILL